MAGRGRPGFVEFGVRDDQTLGATLVMIFRQVNDPQLLVWLGDRGEEGDLVRLALPPGLADSLKQGIAESSPG